MKYKKENVKKKKKKPFKNAPKKKNPGDKPDQGGERLIC